MYTRYAVINQDWEDTGHVCGCVGYNNKYTGRILLVIFQDTPEHQKRFGQWIVSETDICNHCEFHVGQQEVFVQSICREEVFIFVQKQIFKRSAFLPTNWLKVDKQIEHSLRGYAASQFYEAVVPFDKLSSWERGGSWSWKRSRR